MAKPDRSCVIRLAEARVGVPALRRAEDFSDDLLVWCVFYGPRGGEVPAEHAGSYEPGLDP